MREILTALDICMAFLFRDKYLATPTSPIFAYNDKCIGTCIRKQERGDKDFTNRKLMEYFELESSGYSLSENNATFSSKSLNTW